MVLEKTFESPLDRKKIKLVNPKGNQPRRPNQSILKEICSEYSLEGLMLKLKLQYLGHLMQRTDSLEKTLILERVRAGGESGGRG